MLEGGKLLDENSNLLFLARNGRINNGVLRDQYTDNSICTTISTTWFYENVYQVFAVLSALDT